MGQQAVVLIGGNLQLARFFALAPYVQVTLNAPLRIEHQVPGAAIYGQIVHRVCDHAAKPAEAVLAAHRDAPQPAQVVRGSSEGQRRCFPGWRVQLPRGQHTAIGDKLRRRGGLSQQRGKRSRPRPCGQVLVRGMVGRSRLGNGHFSHREAISPVRTQISCGNCAPTRILIIALEEGRES